MSGIVGCMQVCETPVDPVLVKTMLATVSHRGPDGSGTWYNNHVTLGNCILLTTPESLHECLPLHDNAADLTLVCDARIDNRQELAEQLGVHLNGSRVVTDSELILAAYRKWDEECAVKLLGDFAFALWDGKQRRLFCARDHMGVKPFYYSWDGKCFAFGSEIKALFPVIGSRPEINDQRVLDLLVVFHSDARSTFYQGIYRLPRASHLSISERGLRESRYFRFNAERKIKMSSDDAYAEAFRELFTEAVRCRLRSAYPVGSTLSGGLDSSSITCMARSLLSSGLAPMHTFSAIFPGLPPEKLKLCDERQYMDAVIAQGGVKAHFIEADKLCPIEFLKRHRHEEPMPGFNMYIHEGMYEVACREGVRVFLDGMDGDTTVCHGYDLLYDLGRQLRILKLIREARAIGLKRNYEVTLKKVMKEYVVKQYLPQRLVAVLSKGHQLGIDLSILSSNGRDNCDWRKREKYLKAERPHRASGRDMHCASIEALLFQYGMEIIDTIAGKLPLESRYPFWDRRLMEFCLAIPMGQRLHDGQNRMVMRRAMKHLLPKCVSERQGKANLSPHFARQVQGKILPILESLLKVEGVENYIDVDSVLARCRAYVENRESSLRDVEFYKLASVGYWLEGKIFTNMDG